MSRRVAEREDINIYIDIYKNNGGILKKEFFWSLVVSVRISDNCIFESELRYCNLNGESLEILVVFCFFLVMIITIVIYLRIDGLENKIQYIETTTTRLFFRIG